MGEHDALRALPPVQRLLDHGAAGALITATSRTAVVAALRQVLDEARQALRQGRAMPLEDGALVARAAAMLAGRQALRRVINATGIVLHTNLGRAPLAEAAVTAAAEAARGYANLEFDLAQGGRGSRTVAVEAAIRHVSGAEAAIAVNNGAAAILLAITALAGAGEVIVSRGELVEIGGGFRIPDVIRQGGARLIEVGTTNKTRLRDYEDAITPETRLLLKVHQSNYRIIGFTEETGSAELAALAERRGLMLVHDLGSGHLGGLPRVSEPTLREAVQAGADLVCCSGDKLLGGPQAGIIAGRGAAIGTLRRHPLLRALRLDKMCLAALEATLHLHADQAPDRIPVLRMLAQTEAVLQARAETLRAALAAWPGEIGITPSTGQAGGGALPGEAVPSRALVLHHPCHAAETLAARLRQHRPAVVGRIENDCLRLDMLAVQDAELPEIAAALLGGDPPC